MLPFGGIVHLTIQRQACTLGNTVRTTRPPSPPPSPPGRTRFGPYTLLERIAVGGMAEVFRAEEPRSVGEPRVVVVKRMLPSLCQDPGTRAMFDEEAWLGKQLHHPNVVEIFEHGEVEGRPFISMEYVRGVNLSQLSHYLRLQTLELGVGLSLYVIHELLNGLDAVHEAIGPDGIPLQIVHHDISPSNVLLSVHGQVKLGDFGIARTKMRQAHPHAPLNESARGKLGYLSPEQVNGISTDRRADIFSVGTIAAELLMSRPLFSAGTELAVLLAIRDSQIHPFLEFGSRLPLGLTETIATALHKSVRDRTPTAAAFRDALVPFLTEPLEVLQRMLADMASDARSSRDSRITLDLPTPPAPTSADSPMFAETSPMTFDLESGPQVHEVPLLYYRVITSDGNEFGPWSYAEIVEAIATGRVSPSDDVDVGRGTFRPIEKVPDLARHIARHLPGGVDRKTPITKRLGQTSPPAAKVSLTEGGIVKVLADATLHRKSGLLLCELGTVRKEVYLKDGCPEFVSSNLAGELLGEYLVNQGVISRGELDMALAVMPRFEGRLGETLSALGLVEPIQLFQHIAEQVREKLLDLFSWESGICSYYEGVAAPPSGFPLGIDPWRILLDGIARRFEQGLDKNIFKERGNDTLRCYPDIAAHLENANPPHIIQLTLHVLHKPIGAADLMSQIRRFSGEASANPSHLLTLLWYLGAIEWES